MASGKLQASTDMVRCCRSAAVLPDQYEPAWFGLYKHIGWDETCIRSFLSLMRSHEVPNSLQTPPR